MPELDKIGRYIVEHLLGEGAMGSVFKAQDPFIKRTVAIKIVKLDASANEDEAHEFLERFQLEAQISGHLNHPNIVAVYDVGEQEGMPYIAMEYVEGMTLSKFVHQKPKPDAATVMKLLAQLAGALDFAHAKGIVHRDLKPANVLVQANGEPKIMDFGIAKMSGSNLTQTGVFLGTPSYSSPEQIKEGHVDFRSDIFSLGTLSHEALTGKLPFPGQSINAILYKIANEAPTIATDTPGIRAATFRECMSRVLDKAPEKRYQTCSEYTTALLRSLELSSEEKTMVGTVMGRMDATIRDVASVDKGLQRSEFERSVAGSNPAVTTQPKRKRGGLGATMITAILFLGGIAAIAYLYTSGHLQPLIEEFESRFLAEEPVAVSGPPETTPTPPPTEPEPEVPATLERSFSVSSTPPGAGVFLGEEQIGTTPMSYTWRADRGTTATLELRREGYRHTSEKLALTKDLSANFNYTMTALPVSRSINSKPEGATVTIDGRRVGKTPAEGDFQPGKTYRIGLSKSGYADRSFRYTEGGSDPSVLRTVLEKLPPPGTIAVTTLLEDLEIRVDGKKQSGTELTLPPGTYEVALSAPGYFYQESRTVEVTSGGTAKMTTPIAVTIPKLEVIGWFGHIKINDQFVQSNGEPDMTPLTNLRLVVGTHTIALVDPKSGDTIKTETVEVTKGENITLSAND